MLLKLTILGLILLSWCLGTEDNTHHLGTKKPSHLVVGLKLNRFSVAGSLLLGAYYLISLLSIK